MKMPSGMTTARLRDHAEAAVANGQHIMINSGDLLALLTSLDLRERLDKDVELLARHVLKWPQGSLASEAEVAMAAAGRVLKHEPLPDMSGVPS